MNGFNRIRYGLIIGCAILWLGGFGLVTLAQPVPRVPAKPMVKQPSAVAFKPTLNVTATAVQKKVGELEVQFKVNYLPLTRNAEFRSASYSIYYSTGTNWTEISKGDFIARPYQEHSSNVRLRVSATKIKIRVVLADLEGCQQTKEIETTVERLFTK